MSYFLPYLLCLNYRKITQEKRRPTYLPWQALAYAPYALCLATPLPILFRFELTWADLRVRTWAKYQRLSLSTILSQYCCGLWDRTQYL